MTTVDLYAEALTTAGALGEYPWRAEIRPRRSTLGVSYDPDGRIVLAVPPSLTADQVVRAVRSRRDTILRNHFAARDRAPQHAVKTLIGGEGFDWLGRSARLRLTDEPGPVHRVQDGHGWWLIANREDLAAQGPQPVIDWYVREGEAWAAAHLGDWLPRLGITEPPQVQVRGLTGGRWGTYLPARRTVVLHWALFQLSRSLVDLVLVQQLVRAASPRSSAEYRMLLDRVMPVRYRQERDLTNEGRFVWTGDTRPAA